MKINLYKKLFLSFTITLLMVAPILKPKVPKYPSDFVHIADGKIKVEVGSTKVVSLDAEGKIYISNITYDKTKINCRTIFW